MLDDGRRAVGRDPRSADAKVMGPGVTEQVFQGAHEQNESAAMTAQETARQEAAVTPDWNARSGHP
jgi:hypothetical protein